MLETKADIAPTTNPASPPKAIPDIITTAVMRLNVETRGDKELLKEKTEEILAVIGGEEA